MGLSKLEIIEETVAYYSKNPKAKRGLNVHGGCHYYIGVAVPKMCAVGRCLINPKEFESTVINYGSTAIGDLVRGYYNEDNVLIHEPIDFENQLKEEYRGHSLDFWESLQILHDDMSHKYWTDSELTKEGLKYVEELKIKYAE